ncbi:MAG TPA: 50S ribosomal protein L23 [Anaerolineae bacterium]|nr:50S ribosomal protein L23 [Anaerolineae bacterium]
MHLYEVLKRPIDTEKTRRQAAEGQYTFEVDRRANKIQIKRAVEEAFGVDVISVNVMNMPGKRRRFGRHAGRTPSWKKAVVTIAPGQRIEIFEGV